MKKFLLIVVVASMLASCVAQKQPTSTREACERYHKPFKAFKA